MGSHATKVDCCSRIQDTLPALDQIRVMPGLNLYVAASLLLLLAQGVLLVVSVYFIGALTARSLLHTLLALT
jgi:hypothetical protein